VSTSSESPAIYLRYLSVSIITILIRAYTYGNPGKIGLLLSDWFPIVSLPLLYRWSGDFIHKLFAWRIDPLLLSVDTYILAALPKSLMPASYPFWFTDLMQLSYCSYFLIIAGGLLVFYCRSLTRDFADLRLGILFALYGTYILFMLLPAHSPRFEMINPFLNQGGWCSGVVSHFINRTSFCGGSFPSGHAAVSYLICKYIKKNARKWFWPFSIATVLLMVSTVYCGYHYLIDIIAGILWGTLALNLAIRCNLFWQMKGCPVI